MPQKSTIKKLDPRIRNAVDEQIQSGRYTVDSLVEAITALGGRVSRSAVGRYAQRAEEQMAAYREAQEVAKVWVGKLSADPNGDVGRLLTEMLRTLAFDQIGKRAESEKTNSMDVMLLAKALKDIAGTEKLTLERIETIKSMARKEAAEAVTSVAKKGGISDETANLIKRKILGLPDTA